MAQLLLANPRKRRAKRTTAKRKAPARRRTAVSVTSTKVTRRRYKRNPSPRGIMGQVQGAAVGAAGALAVDVLMAKLPMIPATMKTGVMGSAVQGAVSIGLGMIVGKFANKKLGTQIADGGLTVALHGAMRSAVGPSVGLSGYDDNGLLGFDSGLLGFQNFDNDGMGYINPAPVGDILSGFQDIYSSDDDF